MIINGQQFFGGQLKYYKMLQDVKTLKDLNKTECYKVLLETRRVNLNLIERTMISFMWAALMKLKQSKLAEINREGY
jgi:hypothetical protein